MAAVPHISFAKYGKPEAATVVLVAGPDGALGAEAAAFTADAAGFGRALGITGFKGKARQFADLVAPEGLAVDRVIVAGLGKASDLEAESFARLGGALYGKLKEAGADSVAVILEKPEGGEVTAGEAADFALGLRLRAYEFDQYKTKKDEEPTPVARVVIHVAESGKARKAWGEAEAVAEGVELARTLVNLPPNDLGPEDFAARIGELEKLGLEVEILTEKDMKKLGMGALLGVGQGSARPPRLVVMKWQGGKAKEAPLAFIGKGVVFDSGGISIKPAEGMQDMKGDMGGAAAVTGLMRALAGRKAKVNVIGVVGLVENMPDGAAYRPGDILTSMSGQTIEIINTDAEGRLVLADALWYTRDRFKPRLMVNLATLTGACMVALGQVRAGLFANNDELAEKLFKSGEETGEKLWRLPLGAEYDKLIDSRFADMKNTGGRYGGAVTAAQFLKRFVDETPWAHLDIAGTAMNSPDSDISKSWASGFGVRLLERLVASCYEA